MFDFGEFAVVHFGEVDSTNSAARRLVLAGGIAGPTVVHADVQTAGRGTGGRSWSSVPGNVQASYVIPMERIAQRNLLVVYPLALAVSAVVRAIVDTGARVTLKWPNDVLIDARKVSGTLNEVEWCAGRPFLVAGIGINLTQAPDLANGIYPPAALADFTRDVPPPGEVVRRLGRAIRDELAALLRMGFEDVRRRYLAEAHGLNGTVALRPRAAGAAPSTGIYRGIDDDGALILEEAGECSRHYSVDVFPSMARLASVIASGR